MRTDEPALRDLHGPRELAAAEDLQLRVWGGSEREVFPRDALRALEHIGGLVAGALSGGEVVGLVVGLPTATPGVQHSHLLAVHPGWRGAGLARRLKLYQRDWCLARGITRVEWTYDPLRAVNAHFNIHRLGATADTYLDDFYGEMGGINAGVPSDRLVAVWALSGPPPARPESPATLPAVNAPGDGQVLGLPPGAEAVRLHIPADLGALLAAQPARALEWRARTRQAFHTLFGEGYRVTDFLAGDAPAYVLGR